MADESSSFNYRIDRANKDLIDLKTDINKLSDKLEIYYLTIKQYEAEIKPMRSIVYGMVTLVMGSVGAAIIYLVIKKGGI